MKKSKITKEYVADIIMKCTAFMCWFLGLLLFLHAAGWFRR